MDALRRDILPEHLAGGLSALNVAGVVSVQAWQNLEETRWLLDQARRHEFIRGAGGMGPANGPAVVGDSASASNALHRIPKENEL